MTTVTFDTLALARKLEQSGIPKEQAEAVVNALVESHDGLVTKSHFDLVVSQLKSDLTTLKLMTGSILTLVAGALLDHYLNK
jgi:hypothetical protein